jgi:hypothetical protein
MRRDLLDYGASKDIQLLYQQFGSNMNAWISATARLGLPVVMVYANAVSLRMMVLAGFIKDHRLKNFIPRLEETVDEAEWHISGCITEHLRWLDAGVASVGEITWVHQKKFNPQYAGGFSHRNGTEGYQSNDRQEMLQVLAKMRLSRIRAYEQERAVAIESFHMPLLKSVELWKDAARKVGGSKAGIASKR